MTTPSLAQGRGLTKSTCQRCKRNVNVFIDDAGTQQTVDTELIAVVVETKGTATRKSSRAKVLAYRVHAECCEKYKLEDERKAWQQEQKRKHRPPTVREVRAQQKAANAAKRAGLAPPSHAQIAPPPKYATVGDASRAMLANYRALTRFRART